MRNYLLLLLAAAALAAAGCSSKSADKNAQQAPKVPAVTAISGTISLRHPDTAPTLSHAAKLTISLIDISQQPNATIASKTIQPVASLPLSFSLPFTRERVLPADMYVLQAVIVDGKRHYTMPLQMLVLTHDHATSVDVTVVAQATPAENMLAAFNKLKASIGGMKVDQGRALGDKQSRAWQSFRSNGQLQFVRGIVDDLSGDKARTNTDYAYKDDKPWVVVQQHHASAGANPSSTDRAGWDSDGNLVLKQHVVGDTITALSDAEAKQLHQQAQAMFKRAGGKTKTTH